MKYLIMILAIASLVILSGCTAMRACTQEAKLCADGTSVGRQGPNCEFPECPSGEKSYVSTDLEQCKVIKFMCVEGKKPFQDNKGCGCEPATQIANPASVYCKDNGGALEIRTAADGSQTGYWTLTDGTVCEEWAYMRGECSAPSCGNGICEKGEATECPACLDLNPPCNSPCTLGSCPTDCDTTGSKLKAYDCVNRTQACTREYMPVCGQVQVQCIRAPCPPVKETFSNKCVACANSLTISYTEGACEDNLAGGTVPAGNTSEQCTNAGGRWTGYDCEGLSAGQCQEIGGTFNECASACRNNPNATLCTLQCVQVCKFS
jgi:putative hemolysin